MQAVTSEQFYRDLTSWDAAVATTPDLDRFCSSSDWVVPAHEALMSGREMWSFYGSHGRVGMARGRHPDGWRYVEPLEAAWGLACPFVAQDPQAFGNELVALFHEREDDWDVAVLSGLPMHSVFFTSLLQGLWRNFRVMRRPPTRRNIASLDGGLDGFLSRRTRNFRRSLAKSQRLADADGIVTEHHAGPGLDPDALYARVLAVEQRSWKGRDGVGICGGSMERFYQLMCRRLSARDALTVVFARHEDRDVGYVLGGLFDNTYRGLQVSFDADYQRYSVGSLCQFAQITELCASGVALYDLGTYMDYKLRWAETTMDSAVVLLTRQ